MLGLEQQVVTPDGEHDLLLLVDDMGREHQRVLQARGIHHLQHDVVGMPMQLVGMVHFHQLDSMATGRLLTAVSQLLQRPAQRTLSATGEANDRYFMPFAHALYLNSGAKVLLFSDIHNT